MSVERAQASGTHPLPSSSPPQARDGPLMHRVQSEYLEMPGLSLTLDQACRLWGLDDQTCSRVLKELVVRGFLALSQRGTYARRTSP